MNVMRSLNPMLSFVTVMILISVAVVGQAEFDYSGYAEILKRYVDDDGMVNYAELNANRKDLDAFITSLGNLKTAAYKKWSTKERTAFWINAYNAITLRAIIDHYPINASGPGTSRYPENSIRQIPGVWKKLTFNVRGKKWTLDKIEHTALRGWYNEPRIHLALVCAAISCPPLRNGPFYASKLDEQFGDQTRKFLARSKNFRIDRKNKIVYLSSIFKWFGKDFIKTYGTKKGFAKQNKSQKAVLNYLAEFLDGPDAKYLRGKKYKVKYIKYNWALNEQ
jgi:Protein of unknown function, DUF547